MKKKFPIGMRTIKSALAATLCAVVYYFIDRNPTFACIGAVFGMGNGRNDSIVSGGNRAMGTLVGGLIGMFLYGFYLKFYPKGGNSPLLWIFLFIGVIVLIMICNKVWTGGIQPGAVVLCILFFNTPADTFQQYALARILDTFIGVVVAFLVNICVPGTKSYNEKNKQSNQSNEKSLKDLSSTKSHVD